MGIGMVFLAVGFIMFPIATDASQDLIDYSYSGYTATAITDATFTGYTAVVGITPILILVGFLSAAVITGFLGFRVMQAGGSSGFNPGNIMLMGLSIVFIAIGLIIQPVLLDGVSGAYVQRSLNSESDTVSTAVGVTSANVTLTYDIWNNSTAEVISITSNVSGDTPVASTYTAATNRLLVTGLSANASHGLTTTYNNAGLIDGNSGFTGLSALLLIAPMLVQIGFLAAAVFTGFFGIKSLAKESL